MHDAPHSPTLYMRDARRNPTDAYAFERRAAFVSVVTGTILLVIKFVAYFITGSAAVFSDALESIVNVLASLFALYAVILAHAPADREHPYGHGKVEFLSAGFEGGLILAAALVILVRAIEQLLRGPEIEQLDAGLTLVAAAMLVNAAVGFFLIRSGQRHGSIALEADGKHLLSDAVTSLVVLVALAIYWITKWKWIDPLAALLVAGYIALLGAGLLRRSAAGLMDEQDVEDDRLLRQILDSHVGAAGKEPRICSYHKLRHRHSGRYHWVDFHMMVPADWGIDRAHQAGSAIEYEIEQAIGEGKATAHVEPWTAASGDCAWCGSTGG